SDPRAREHLTYVGPTASKGPAVIVQNGIDRPLHVVGYPNAASTQNRAVPINPIDTPVAARATVPEAGVFDSLPVVAGAATATASAGGAFTAATGGSVGASGGSWVWTTGNAVVVGDWGQIVMDTDSMSVLGGPDLRAVPQIGLVVEADDDSWWDAVKLWANVNYDGGGYGWELIHDPTAPPGSAKNNRVHVLTNKTGVVVSAYAFDDKSHGGYSLASINGLKIEVADALLSAASTFRVHWVYASGWVPGTAQYAVARKAGLSESESGGVFLSQGAFGETTTFLRTAATTSAGTTLETSNARFLHPMFQSGNVPTDFVFPIDARLFYHYRVPVVNPWMVELSGAYADTWSVYRKDPGDAEFYLAYDLQVGVYNSILQTWGLTNGSEGGIYSSEDAVPPERKDYRRRVPDTYNEPTPIGQAGVFVDKRLYSGTLVKDPQGDNFVCGSVMVSEEGYPGRFRRYGRFDSGDNDPSSGYEVRLGAEEVMALGVLQGSGSAQVTSVYCVTDRAFYSIDRVLNGNRLFNIRRIAPSGTQSRRGTASMGTELYWLDQVRALRSTQSGLPDLSQASVQDRLDAVVDWDGVCVSTFRNRLFIARGERVLTYIAGYWESDD
ncbi:MAG TPA: hypothetical protein VNI20_11295, partial [Fimbriimonadaceae bacterium]|nr:hypothetical protein [Fimbriimonadaceae bacterium]